jgi:hypothetical protein
MAKKQQFDGVIVGVRLLFSGKVDWARVFLRRGAIFSDRVILSRKELIEQIKNGKKFVIGERVVYQAGTFKISQSVSVTQKNGEDVLVSGDSESPDEGITSHRDFLDDVPII